MTTDPLIRLLRKCEWSGDCLVWTGKTVRGRYGQIRVGTRTSDPNVYVHRYTYERFVGPIPAGTELDHVRSRGCSSSLCVLPWHLEPVTHVENQRRSRLDVCRAGLHDLTDPANQRFDEQGRRRGCLGCYQDRARERALIQKGLKI